MGEGLVSKGADVLSFHRGTHILVGSSRDRHRWHQLSKGHRVNIPEPDTWMLPVEWPLHGGCLAGGARQRICMCVYSATLAIALGRVVFSS